MSYLYIKTYGCQMNEYDSEVMAGLLHKKGFYLTSRIEKADFILINTCYVREKVKHKIYSFLGEIKKLKDQNPDLLIGVGGCLAQKEPEEIRRRAPHVDIIWGTLNLHKLPEFLESAGESPLVKVEKEGNIPEHLPVKRSRKFSAYIPIIRGCNNFCAYCNVPYVRGKEVSRPSEFIIREVKEAAKQGFKEVILLGQNVNSYGRDLPEKIDFADLLSLVNQVDKIARIRFITSHPKDLSEKLILTMASLDKVCEHLHLPLQAGSDRILKRMGRGYTQEKYLELVDKLRKMIPGISLTTDIIVGFPGETEQDFNQTLRMLELIKFDGAFTFEYSALPGTRAAQFNDQVPPQVKRERLRQVIQLQLRITEELNQSWVGRKVEVLVEGVSQKNPEELQGRTRENKMVVFPADKDLTGELVQVKIKKAGCWALRGEIV